jgi:hypothetical protein
MEAVLKTLATLSYLCALVAWMVGAYEQTVFYRTWRQQKMGSASKLELARDAPYALFSKNLSEKCQLHRRRLLWALAAFIGFVALGTIALFGVYGPNPERRHLGVSPAPEPAALT